MSRKHYRIFETDSFQKDCKKNISNVELKFIEKKLAQLIYPQLREEPHFGPHIKKLKDYDPEAYRYRIGNLRLFYLIDEDERVVVVSAIRHRSVAYR